MNDACPSLENRLLMDAGMKEAWLSCSVDCSTPMLIWVVLVEVSRPENKKKKNR